MKFLDLIEQDEPYTYHDLLQTDEWKNVRDRILTLDIGRCRKCKSYGTIERNGKLYDDLTYSVHGSSKFGRTRKDKKHLQVHHKYYIKDKLPWQYKDECYLTLCDSCHKQVHKAEKFLVYEDDSLSKVINMTPCKRCKGMGWFENYRHIENGMCFECHGFQYYELVEFYKQNGSF